MNERDYDICPFCHRVVEASEGIHSCDPDLTAENLADDERDIYLEQVVDIKLQHGGYNECYQDPYADPY